MAVERLEATAGWVLLLAGLLLAVASVTSIGQAQSWDVADAFAADSVRRIRRAGMLLGALGLAALVAATPILIVVARGSAGARWIVGGWVAFATGAVLFAMVLGLAGIAMPALGQLAQAGVLSPQQAADEFIRQPLLAIGFLGGNLTFLSWMAIGYGLAHAPVFPAWLGWVVGASAIAAWLGFLHVPVLQQVGGPLWPTAIALCGVQLMRIGGAMA